MDATEKWPDPATCGCLLPGTTYRVTYESHGRSEKRGLKDDRTYVADLSPDPKHPRELKGTGRYTARMNTKNANCYYDKDGENEQWYTASGNLEASGSVVDVPTDFMALLSGKKPAGGKSPTTEHLNVVLATTDWPIIPFGGGYAKGEEKDDVKGLGSEMLPLMQLTGATTRIHHESITSENKCNGKETLTVDVTIETNPGDDAPAHSK
jgi:hypothetical protein